MLYGALPLRTLLFPLFLRQCERVGAGGRVRGDENWFLDRSRLGERRVEKRGRPPARRGHFLPPINVCIEKLPNAMNGIIIIGFCPIRHLADSWAIRCLPDSGSRSE